MCDFTYKFSEVSGEEADLVRNIPQYCSKRFAFFVRKKMRKI